MAQDTESFNKDLYDFLKVRGYNPVPLNSQNQRVKVSQDADVIQFTFTKDGKDYGDAWVTVDDAQNIIVYYDEEQQDSPSTTTPGVEYDDSWTGFCKALKMWAQRRQLGFVLKNASHVGDDMRQRDYYRMKEKLGESKRVDEMDKERGSKRDFDGPRGPDKTAKPISVKQFAKGALKSLQRGMKGWEKGMHDVDTVKAATKSLSPDQKEKALAAKASKGSPAELQQKLIKREKKKQVDEGYYPMGKKASYNDAVPNVKIILQHNRSLEEGEQRYRNVARIFLENTDGERFLAPTTRPGIARVYARHIAEGGLPNDERWNHIKSICEDYNKMAGFVRATRNKQFNESAQQLISEGVNHYNNLRETLQKLAGHRGYHAYFESYTPTLMETDGEDISEMFMASSMDPRIESALPIISRLQKPVNEMNEISSLASWADEVINEKMDSTTKTFAVPADEMLDEAPGAETLSHNQSTAKSNLKAFGLAEEDLEEDMGFTPERIKSLLKINKDPEVEKALTAKLSAISKKKGLDESFDDFLNPPQRYKISHPSQKDEYILAKNEKDALAKAQQNWKLPSSNQIKVEPVDAPQTTQSTQSTPAQPATGRSSHEPLSVSQARQDAETAYSSNKVGGIAGGLGKAIGRNFLGVNEEEVDETIQLDELSSDLLDRYMTAADKEALQSHTASKALDPRSEKAIGLKKKYKQRAAGLSMAGKKLAGLAKVPATESEEQVDEDLGPEQKRVGQLGPTEKVKNNNIGKLVGASESKEFDELKRIIDIARFK